MCRRIKLDIIFFAAKFGIQEHKQINGLEVILYDTVVCDIAGVQFNLSSSKGLRMRFDAGIIYMLKK